MHPSPTRSLRTCLQTSPTPRGLEASLGSKHRADELEGAGMAPFFYLPHTMFVAARGLEHFEPTQYRL